LNNSNGTKIPLFLLLQKHLHLTCTDANALSTLLMTAEKGTLISIPVEYHSGHPMFAAAQMADDGRRVLHGTSCWGGLAIVSGGFNDSKVGPGEKKNLKMNLLRAGIGQTMNIRLSQCIRRHFHILLRIINSLLVNLDQTTVSCQILQSLLLGWLHS